MRNSSNTPNPRDGRGTLDRVTLGPPIRLAGLMGDPRGVVIFDTDLRIAWANPAAGRLGEAMPVARWPGRRLGEVLPGLDVGQRASPGEVANARAVISLAEANPAGALCAVQDVLDGAAPVIGYVTRVETHLLARLAHRQLGDQRAANQAAERALALAEPDRLVLPFAMTGSAELLKALPRHETAHAALLTDILDVLHGSSPAVKDQSASPERAQGAAVLPTNLSRTQIARELFISLNTVNTRPQDLRQTPGPRPLLRSAARARTAATVGRPYPLARRSPDRGDERSPSSARPWRHGSSTRCRRSGSAAT